MPAWWPMPRTSPTPLTFPMPLIRGEFRQSAGLRGPPRELPQPCPPDGPLSAYSGRGMFAAPAGTWELASRTGQEAVVHIPGSPRHAVHSLRSGPTAGPSRGTDGLTEPCVCGRSITREALSQKEHRRATVHP
jgi:hypothetical protein